MTSNDLKRPQLTSKVSFRVIKTFKPNTSQKNKLKGGSLNEILEIDDTYSDEIIETKILDRLN